MIFKVKWEETGSFVAEVEVDTNELPKNWTMADVTDKIFEFGAPDGYETDSSFDIVSVEPVNV